MEQDAEYEQRKQDLRRRVFVEYSTKEVKPSLIEYVLLLADEAKNLPKKHLLADGSPGHSIASDICEALLYHDSEVDIVENDGWFNANNEPTLYAVFEAAGTLDGTPNQPDKWRRLFELAEQLKK